MPCSAPSSASTLTSPSRPCFAATYPALYGEATRPWTEATARKRPSPDSRERLPGVAREQERARQQHGEQRVPALLGELVDRRDVLEARVRDDRVEPAEAGRARRRPRRGCRPASRGRPRTARPARPGRGAGRRRARAAPSRSSRAAIARPMPLPGTCDEQPCRCTRRRYPRCGSGGLGAGRRQDQDRPAVRRRPATRTRRCATGSAARILPTSSESSAPTLRPRRRQERDERPVGARRRRRSGAGRPSRCSRPSGRGGMKTTTESTSSTYLNV